MSGNSSPPRVSHSPYGTPVIPVAAMSESTRQFYDAVRSTRSSLSSPGGSSHGSGHDEIQPPSVLHPQSSATTPGTLPPMHRASVGSLASSTPSSSHPSRGGTPPRGNTPTYPSYMRGGLQFFQGVMASPPPPPSTFRGGADILPPPSASSSADFAFYPPPPAPHHPPQQPTTPPSPKSLPGTIMHQELGAAGLTWVPLNAPAEPEPNRPRFRCRRLFIGQLPFEVTTSDVRRLIFAATGINTLRLDVRGSGCMLGYYPTDDEAERVKALSGTALFDQGGAWVATTDAQFEALQQYQVKIQSWTSFFLPRSAMIIEDERKSLHYRLSNAE